MLSYHTQEDRKRKELFCFDIVPWIKHYAQYNKQNPRQRGGVSGEWSCGNCHNYQISNSFISCQLLKVTSLQQEKKKIEVAIQDQTRKDLE